MTREEAIEVYNGLINKKIKEAFEFFAPELCESEDERIRKIITLALIATEDELSAFYSTHNITRNECTDWLEKQKEQKPTVIENLAEHIKAEFEGFRNLLKKKGIDYQPGQIYWDDFAKLFVSSVRKYGLQKTVEWSEEDEAIYDSIIREIVDKDMAMTNLQKRWLKSLRPSWKPSEEQMEALEWMLTTVTMKDGGRGIVLKKLVNDLKKLI